MLLNFHAHLDAIDFCTEKSNCSHVWKYHILYLFGLPFRQVKALSESHFFKKTERKLKHNIQNMLALLINNL